MSLCFIGAVGYAAIQEAFDETLSVKLMALMANITLIVTLLGPLAGAAFIHVLTGVGTLILGVVAQYA